jgi:uncharacterized protein YabE (DUF348 family)
MKSIKSFVAGLIVGIMLLSAFTVFADNKNIEAFYNNIKLAIDGKAVELKDTKGKAIEPFIYEGTTYLPVRAIAEALGMEVKFNETTNTVELDNKKEVNNVVLSDTNTTGTITDWKTTYEEYLMVQTRLDNSKYIYPKSIAKQFNLVNGKEILPQNSILKVAINEDTETVDFILREIGNTEITVLANISTNNDAGTYLIPYDEYQNNILPKLIEAVKAQ